jgi:Mg-chelatase subunit ChlD
VPTSRVYLLLDISGSMDEEKLAQARRGGTEFAENAIRRGYLVGVIQFSSWATLKVAPTENRRAIKNALTEIGLQATTNMASAIKLATEHLGSDGEHRAIVLVTDGFPDSEARALAAAEKAKRRGITIIAIGTDDADRAFLARIASATELSRKVAREELHVAITDAARLLPAKSSR